MTYLRPTIKLVGNLLRLLGRFDLLGQCILAVNSEKHIVNVYTRQYEIYEKIQGKVLKLLTQYWMVREFIVRVPHLERLV